VYRGSSNRGKWPGEITEVPPKDGLKQSLKCADRPIFKGYFSPSQEGGEGGEGFIFREKLIRDRIEGAEKAVGVLYTGVLRRGRTGRTIGS